MTLSALLMFLFLAGNDPSTFTMIATFPDGECRILASERDFTYANGTLTYVNGDKKTTWFSRTKTSRMSTGVLDTDLVPAEQLSEVLVVTAPEYGCSVMSDGKVTEVTCRLPVEVPSDGRKEEAGGLE